VLDTIVFVAQIVLAFIGGYQLLLSFFGWYRRKTKLEFPPQKSFAILVAAHNEEKVIGALVENLKQLNYPKELYDIMVICDNCTDRTADIVREHGVYAFERTNPNKRGKGYAIEWMLNELWKLPRQYDAVVMLDADNLVDPDFLIHMNNDLCAGKKVIQGYLDTKNPNDSWITAAYAVDASREVFAVPGPIYSPRSAGTNALIRQGAKLITCAADLLAELAHLIQVPASHPSTLPAYTPSLSAEEAAVYSLIADYGPLTIDELVERCQNSFGQLHTILLSLQIKCLIEQLPGSVYVKI